MESLLLSLLNRTALRLHDLHGRPIGEKVYPELFDKIETKEMACPYRDSRFNHTKLMNFSALNDIGKSWRAILYFFTKVRYFMRQDPKSLTPYSDFWKCWVVATYLPEYLFLKNGSQITDGGVPVFAAGIYKVSVGFINSTISLVIDEALRSDLPPLTSDFIYRYADSEGELIARDCAHRSGVCAGPPKLIMEAAESMIDSDFIPDAKLEAELCIYVPSFDEYMSFATAALGVALGTMLYASELIRASREFGAESDIVSTQAEEEISQTARVLLSEASRLADLPDSEFEIIRARFMSMVAFGIQADSQRQSINETKKSYAHRRSEIELQYLPQLNEFFRALGTSLQYSDASKWKFNHSSISSFYGWISKI